MRMAHFGMALLLIFTIGFISFASAQMLYCVDSDGGKAYDEKGDVNFSSASSPNPAQMYKQSDSCKLGTSTVTECAGANCYLAEYHCAGTENNWNLGEDSQSCLLLGFEGCRNGECYGTAPAAATGTCFDGIQNRDESDIDCGGLCGPTCTIGQDCELASDCESGNCTDRGVCDFVPGYAPADNCTNGIQDYDESGIDCGGAYCTACTTDTQSPGETAPPTDYTTPPNDYTEPYTEPPIYGPPTDFDFPVPQDCLNCAPIVCIGSGGEFGWVVILALIAVVLFFILKVIELILRFLSLFKGGGTVNIVEKRVEQKKDDGK